VVRLFKKSREFSLDFIIFMMQYLLTLQFRDFFDIFLSALLIYFILVFIRQSRSFVIAYGAGIYLLVIYLAHTLSLTLTREIFQILSTVFLLVFIVIFQREFRRFFDWVFATSWRFLHPREKKVSNDTTLVIIKAIQEMIRKKNGAIIVLPGELPIDGAIEGGFVLDGLVSLPLLLSIFDPSSPGHDGAVILEGDRLRKFGVHLPLAENYSGYRKSGTRHRAAAGITEQTDALAIVVSEERGTVSLAFHGDLKKISKLSLLEERLNKFILKTQELEATSFWDIFLINNGWLKLVALLLALALRVIL